MNTRALRDVPFVPAPWMTTVAGYLLTGLAEVGLASVFGVPGTTTWPSPTPVTSAPAPAPDSGPGHPVHQ